jgi:glycosyltransferase involved in cell wall biosynthesis
VKIVHLTATLRSGGAERQLVETLKFFQNKKDIFCEVVVMSDDIHYDYIENLNIKIHQIIRKTKKDPSIFLKFYRLFRESKPDLIHSWHSMCSMYVIPAVKLLDIKLVNNSLRDAPKYQNMRDLKWYINRLTFPFSDVIAANSYAGLDAYNVPDKKRACLHNGFDFSRIQKIAEPKNIRKLFDIHTKYVVGMVASFSNKKDYKTFVDAAHIVLEKRRDITFMAIGGGDNFDEIKNRIKPEFQANFKMPGTQKKIMNIVNIFDIGILTTNTRVHGEGIPNVVMECMALKKPVIVTDCGGNKELVEDNLTGFLVEPENPIQLANKIFLLLDNDTLALKLGLNGYKKLVKEFSLDVMGNEILNLYRKLSNHLGQTIG